MSTVPGDTPGSGRLVRIEEVLTMTDSPDLHLPTQTGRLAPIRFFIDKALSNKYQQVGALANEIANCFPKADLDIKFAYMREHKVFIVTDDSRTYRMLSNMENWPKQAFEKGLSVPISNVNKTYKIKLLGLPTTQDIAGLETMLENEGISKARRITTRSAQSTSLVEAIATGKANYDRLIKEGFKLVLWSKIYKVAPRNSMSQCFKCLKPGHLKARCPSDSPTCINCGQNDCVALVMGGTCLNAPRCANCDGAHSGVSRKCPVLTQHNKESQQKELQAPSINPNVWRRDDPRHPLSVGGTHPVVSRSSDELNNMKNEITDSVIEKLNTIIESKIDSMLNTLFDKLLIKLGNLPQNSNSAHDSGSNTPSPSRQTQPGTKKRRLYTLNSITNASNTEKTRSKSSGSLPHNSPTSDHAKTSSNK